jgi:RNase P/RNase MRP subunit POP5
MIKRQKRRYLALNIECNQSFEEQLVLNAINSSVQRLFGEYGASQANVRLIKYFPEKSQLVIMCSHRKLEQVRAAIASTIEVKGERISIHVVAVSGTLKSLSKKA